jgi:predicted dinucleotide-binding enzyme
LTSVVDALGAGVTAGTTHDAAGCPIVALAVPWAGVHDALALLSWSGEIVIDATNAVLIPSLEPVPLGGLTSSEIVAQLVRGGRLVKAANTYAADVLGADPREGGGRRVMLVSGDDPEAKDRVGKLFDAAGFFPIDLGDLVNGGSLQQAGGPLAGHNLVRMPAPWE